MTFRGAAPCPPPEGSDRGCEEPGAEPPPGTELPEPPPPPDWVLPPFERATETAPPVFPVVGGTVFCASCGSGWKGFLRANARRLDPSFSDVVAVTRIALSPGPSGCRRFPVKAAACEPDGAFSTGLISRTGTATR